MRGAAFLGSLGVILTIAHGTSWSAWPARSSPAPHLSAPPGSCIPCPPGQPQPDPGTPAPAPMFPADAFAQAPEAGTQPGASFNPIMFGDLIGPTACRVIRVPGRSRAVTVFDPRSESSRTVFVPVRRTIQVPIASRGAFKIADNESPRPVDRVYAFYNYFNDVFGTTNGPNIPRSDLHREVIGFEKTFFDGNVSFGARLPFLQLTGFDRLEESDVGDLTFTLKLALLNNPETSNVFSVGLTVTAPTGEDTALLNDEDIRSTLLQPWAGFIYNLGSFYVHGFSSLVVPTDSDDVTLWFNDVGIGWWAYRSNDPGSLVRAVVPTLEAHVNTPLNHRGGDCPINFRDTVNLTGGVHWILRQNCVLSVGVVTPVTGPRPFDVEAIGSLNFRF